MNINKTLAVLLVCAGLSAPAVTLGSPIGPGFYLFKTPDDGKTFVELGHLGKIPLKGNSELFQSYKPHICDRLSAKDAAFCVLPVCDINIQPASCKPTICDQQPDSDSSSRDHCCIQVFK
jgi:hypothetical protein